MKMGNIWLFIILDYTLISLVLIRGLLWFTLICIAGLCFPERWLLQKPPLLKELKYIKVASNLTVLVEECLIVRDTFLYIKVYKHWVGTMQKPLMLDIFSHDLGGKIVSAQVPPLSNVSFVNPESLFTFLFTFGIYVMDWCFMVARPGASSIRQFCQCIWHMKCTSKIFKQKNKKNTMKIIAPPPKKCKQTCGCFYLKNFNWNF